MVDGGYQNIPFLYLMDSERNQPELVLSDPLKTENCKELLNLKSKYYSVLY